MDHRLVFRKILFFVGANIHSTMLYLEVILKIALLSL